MATAATLFRMGRDEVAVDLLVVLSVVPDEQPADVRGTRASRSSVARLWALPAPEQRSVVGPQSVSSSGPPG
jgi:hypothetical protein